MSRRRRRRCCRSAAAAAASTLASCCPAARRPLSHAGAPGLEPAAVAGRGAAGPHPGGTVWSSQPLAPGELHIVAPCPALVPALRPTCCSLPATATHAALQVEPTPPLPALRLALLISCLALATVCLIAGTQAAAVWALARRRPNRVVPPGADNCSAACSSAASAADGCPPSGGGEEAGGQPALAGAAATIHPAAAAAAAVEKLPTPAGGTLVRPPSYALARQQQASFVRAGSSFTMQPGDPLPPRPELALARGLSRRVRGMSAGRPRLVRGAALALITVSFSAAYLCQVAAPGVRAPTGARGGDCGRASGYVRVGWRCPAEHTPKHALLLSCLPRSSRRLRGPICCAIDQYVHRGGSGAGAEPAAAPPPALGHLAQYGGDARGR